MEGRKKPHMEKYKAVTNFLNYDVSCMLRSLRVELIVVVLESLKWSHMKICF